MEIDLRVVEIFLLLFVLGSNFMLFFQMEKLEKRFEKNEEDHASILNDLLENFNEIDEKIISISDDIHRFMQAQREPLEAAKPIKPNNWDSIKEAFKGPVRIEVNERD